MQAAWSMWGGAGAAAKGLRRAPKTGTTPYLAVGRLYRAATHSSAARPFFCLPLSADRELLQVTRCTSTLRTCGSCRRAAAAALVQLTHRQPGVRLAVQGAHRCEVASQPASQERFSGAVVRTGQLAVVIARWLEQLHHDAVTGNPRPNVHNLSDVRRCKLELYGRLAVSPWRPASAGSMSNCS